MEEVENYRFQLKQVQEALENDPKNEELLKLAGDLAELIDLYSSLEETEQKKEQQPKKGLKLEVGDVVLGRWNDGQFYEALVVGEKDQAYEICFTGSDKLELKAEVDLKIPIKGKARPTILETQEIQVGEIETKPQQKEKRKKKKEKKIGAKEIEDQKRIDNWKKFSSKVKKPVKKERISTFTANQDKKKHVFDY